MICQTPTLDPAFSPFVRFHRDQCRAATRRLRLALEREGGNIAVFESPIGDPAEAATLFHAERLAKLFLWAAGGWRLYVDGPAEIARHLAQTYSTNGARAFDTGLMAAVYEKPFQVVAVEPGDLPSAHESAAALGGNLDGYRIGFDLGASNCKVAAVRDGQPVYSDEIPWNPSDQTDPEYHYRVLNEALRQAAAHLPRVDAIGGSSAGVIVGNRIMASSLLRSIPAEKLPAAHALFQRLRKEWGVPVEVANDGDVTALAEAMSLGVKGEGLLGIALGSSLAVGYIDPAGKMNGWINELAFAPLDIAPQAAVDEWSGDQGAGVMYLSQQGIGKLLPAAGISLPGLALPERLRKLRAMAEACDPAARAVYETLGVYLGHALPLYAGLYRFNHVLLLGGVTAGPGGNFILEKAREILRDSYPELARVQLHLPSGKNRRVGQAVAAASLPKLHQ